MKRQLLVALAGVAFSGVCAANPTGHFSHLGVFLERCSVEFTDSGSTYEEDCGGLTLSGSGLINETFFIAAEFSGLETDDTDIELKRNFVALGFRTDISDQTDVYGRASLQKVKLVVPGFGSGSDDGLGLAGGLSFNASESVNLFAELELLALGDIGGAALWLGGAFDLAPQLSLVVSLGGYGLEDDFGTGYTVGGFRLGGRFNF